MYLYCNIYTVIIYYNYIYFIIIIYYLLFNFYDLTYI